MKMSMKWLVSGICVTGLLAGAMPAMADDDDRYEHGGHHERSHGGIHPIKNDLYKSECGACHFAYQPGLLSSRSWGSLMDSLDKHFGENAELTQKRRETIKAYLIANASDAGRSGASRDEGTQLRISELSWFRREHHEIPSRMVSGNPKVTSFSNCQACHSTAADGDFSEHRVNIPGFGRWDD